MGKEEASIPVSVIVGCRDGIRAKIESDMSDEKLNENQKKFALVYGTGAIQILEALIEEFGEVLTDKQE